MKPIKVRKTPRNFHKAQFLPYAYVHRNKAPEGVLWYDVTKNAEYPYCLFSPFYVHSGIPIPGMPGRTSDTVEGIWQGLKVIKKEIAPRYFRGIGKKRGGKPSGHQFGTDKRLLKLEEARRRIYLPAYEWVLENKIPQEIIDSFLENIYRYVPQYFYDYESNGVIGKDLPLAHSAVLVRWLNRQVT